MLSEAEIYADWTRTGIAFEAIEHRAVFTVDDSAGVHDALPAAHTKNLFLKDKSRRLWLIVLPSDRRADLKAFAAQLGAGKFSFASAGEMEAVLGVTPGSVTPLAIANTVPGEVSLVFDASFRDAARIAVHPLRNTATVALAPADLIAWLERRGYSVSVAALP